MNFLYYALITVVCWGTYGVCMHIGSTNMGDKENGRIMAFLMGRVGILPDRSGRTSDHS